MITKRMARKQHQCDVCGFAIKPGDKYTENRTRLPVYDKRDNQTGIEYAMWRYCSGCYHEESMEQ